MFQCCVFLLLIAIWCYFFLGKHPTVSEVSLDIVLRRANTGDLILFHALDNINAALIGSYYTHVGIVYRSAEGVYLFEAWNPMESTNHPREWAHGIALVDLEQRLSSYRGYVYWKRLAHPPQDSERLYDFIYWSLANMKYDTQVIRNGVRKLIFNERLKKKTNCGELVYLALIRLGLLHPSRFYQNRKYHLRWVCDLTHLDNGNRYAPPVYVPQPYFSSFFKN